MPPKTNTLEKTVKKMAGSKTKKSTAVKKSVNKNTPVTKKSTIPPTNKKKIHNIKK